MADNQEYNNLVNQKSNVQSRYNACSNRIEDCDYLLRRLRTAKETISTPKRVFSDLRKNQRRIKNDKHDWEGRTFSSFNSHLTAVTEDNDYYYEHKRKVN